MQRLLPQDFQLSNRAANDRSKKKVIFYTKILIRRLVKAGVKKDKCLIIWDGLSICH